MGVLLALSSSVAGAASSKQPEQSFVPPGSGGADRVVGRMAASHGNLDAAATSAFRWEDDALLHVASGLRLPKSHDGCTLIALEKIGAHGASPVPFERGGAAEYDCGNRDLSYMNVQFEVGTGFEKQVDPLRALATIALGLARVDAGASALPCTLMNTAADPALNQGFRAAQCGAKWRRPRGKEVFASATMIFGRKDVYVALTNTCAEPHCMANRLAFAHFGDTLDLSSIAKSDRSAT